MFIPATSDSELEKKMQEKVDRKGFEIKVVEKSGTKVGRLLQSNDLFKR